MMIHMQHNKVTILPLHLLSESVPLPMPIADNLTVEGIDGILRSELFDLWSDYVSKKNRDTLASTDVGILHRFSSSHHISKPEADSQDQIYRVFILLRLIRPTNLRYCNIQVDFNTGAPNVFGFTEPSHVPNTPNFEIFNKFHHSHFRELARLCPRFLKFVESAPRNLIRAVRMFETGYSDITDPFLQFVAWTIGLQSVFSQDQNILTGSKLIDRINERLGAEKDIYSESERELFPFPTPVVRIGDILPDIFLVRDRAIHGVGVPTNFEDKKMTSVATGAPIEYMDVLREGTSFILRKLILQEVEEKDA